MLQSFNHRENVGTIAERLHQVPDSELIICEDDSSDGSLEEWDHLLDRPNDFLVRSSDLHEIRSYDRASGLARGELLCLLQDDDIPPADPSWAQTVRSVFDELPDLVVLGGFHAFSDLEFDEQSGHLTSLCPVNGPTSQTSSGIPFMFAEIINAGPIFLRRAGLARLVGFDLSYSGVGESGIHFDHELCLRVWLRGGQVGWTPCPFTRFVGGRSTLQFGQAENRASRARRNYAKLLAEYGQRLADIQARVEDANRATSRFSLVAG